jgi:hypothetical protein
MDCSGFAAVQFPTLPIRPQTVSSKTPRFLGFDGTGMGYQVPITCLTCKGSQVQVLVRPPNKSKAFSQFSASRSDDCAPFCAPSPSGLRTSGIPHDCSRAAIAACLACVRMCE